MPTPTVETHPTGLKFVLWGVLAERASFYGMKTLLAMYLTSVMYFTDDVAGPINNVFGGLCYLLPLLGGFVAERYLGRFKTIIYFAVPCIVGYLVLGNSETRTGFFVGLMLITIGSGVIKPNISPLMGVMYDREGKSQRLRTKAFAWFYAAIKVGAASSMLALPIVRDHFGYGTAFTLSGVLMTASLVAFYVGKEYYPTEKKLPPRTAVEKAEDWKVLRNLSGIFLLISFFWTIYEQSANTWVYFTRDHLELHGIAPDMVQSLGPILILIMLPLFSVFWPWLEKRRGKKASYTQKMTVGFGLTVVCMVILGIAGWLATSGNGKISIWWEIVAFVILTMAELCVSTVGLEMAYTEAPKRLKSTVTALFLATTFVGSLPASMMSAVYPHMNPGTYFMGSAVLMLVVMIAFHFTGKRYEAQRNL